MKKDSREGILISALCPQGIVGSVAPSQDFEVFAPLSKSTRRRISAGAQRLLRSMSHCQTESAGTRTWLRLSMRSRISLGVAVRLPFTSPGRNPSVIRFAAGSMEAPSGLTTLAVSVVH